MSMYLEDEHISPKVASTAFSTRDLLNSCDASSQPMLTSGSAKASASGPPRAQKNRSTGSSDGPSAGQAAIPTPMRANVGDRPAEEFEQEIGDASPAVMNGRHAVPVQEGQPLARRGFASVPARAS